MFRSGTNLHRSSKKRRVCPRRVCRRTTKSYVPWYSPPWPFSNLRLPLAVAARRVPWAVSRSSSDRDLETYAAPSSFPLVEAEVRRAETSAVAEVHYVAEASAVVATR